MAEYAHLSELNPEYVAITAKLPTTHIIPEDVVRAREWCGSLVSIGQQALRPFLPAETEYQVTDRQIEVEGGIHTLARCIVPTPKTGEDGRYPVIFWMHGGGWMMGDPDMDDYNMRRLAVEFRLSIVNYDYRLAPEHPFPAAPNDCFTALKYIVANPDLLLADFSKGFIVGGSSAGGNLAAVVAHLALKDPSFKDTPLTGQLLSSPALLHPDAYPKEYKSSLLSIEQNKDAGVLPKSLLDAFLRWYKPVPNDPKFSPLLNPSLQGLPPAYFQICGLDPLRDEAFLYDKHLREAGVATKVDVYPGVPHGFLLIMPPTTELGSKWINDFHRGLKWLLTANKSED